MIHYLQIVRIPVALLLIESTMTPTNRTPVPFVHAILLGYEKYQVDPAAALHHANISRAQLNDSSAYITTAQFESFMELAMRELDDEALGWFSRPFWWGSYGMLARASVGAPDLRVALTRWCRNHNLLTRDVILRMTETAGVATIGIIEHKPLGAAREFCLVSILRNMLSYSSWLIDSRVTCMYTAFPFAGPPHAQVYPGMFSGPLRFDASHASTSFAAAYPLDTHHAARKHTERTGHGTGTEHVAAQPAPAARRRRRIVSSVKG